MRRDTRRTRCEMMRSLRGGEGGSRAEGVSLQRLRLQALLHFVVRVSQGKRGVNFEKHRIM